MTLSKQALTILSDVSADGVKLGDLRKLAKSIKTNHALATELWSTQHLMARQLAILIMDKKAIDEAYIDSLAQDIKPLDQHERNQLTDWLMANQLNKDKRCTALMLSWEFSDYAIKRRIFWYHQARLRWVGQVPPDNTLALLESIESNIEHEEPEVQWAMNFTAGQIGIFDESLRDRCIKLGKRLGLYKNDMVSKGCTPNYLPEFIAIEVAKRNG
jgi:3-methyladenine DNA glycosylase AlkD